MISICVHFPIDVMFTFSFGAEKTIHIHLVSWGRGCSWVCAYTSTHTHLYLDSFISILEKSCTSTLILFLRDHKECSNKHECACVSKVCWFKVPAYIPGHDIVLFLVCWQKFHSDIHSGYSAYISCNSVSLCPFPPSSYLPQHTLTFASLMTVNLTEVRQSPGIVHFLYG